MQGAPNAAKLEMTIWWYDGTPRAAAPTESDHYCCSRGYVKEGGEGMP